MTPQHAVILSAAKNLLPLCLLVAAACGPKDGIRTLRTTTSTEADLGRIK